MHGIFDVVHGDVKRAKYWVEHDVERDIEILPFDGAGLVSVETAKEWAKELKINYLPGAWQFRAVPGLKGVLFVFDINGFINEYGSSQITDIWGKIWDLKNDEIDAIFSRSQFKFWPLYSSMEEWRNAYLGDKAIVITPVLSRTEVNDFIFQVTRSIGNVYDSQDAIIDIDYFIRVVTIIKYTNFKFEDVENVEDIEQLTEFLYGTPLYAMLVGTPCRPVYFNGKKYTSPLVDIEQYLAILQTIKDTLPKQIKWNM